MYSGERRIKPGVGRGVKETGVGPLPCRPL